MRCKDVFGLATYACIELQAEEINEMTRYLNETVAGVLAPIRGYELEGVEPVFHPISGLVNVMRDDVCEQGLEVDAALSNAGRVQGRFFDVPAILASGGDV